MNSKSIGLAIAVVSLLFGVPMPAHAQVTNLGLNPTFEDSTDVIRDDPAWTQWATWNSAAGAGTVTAIDTSQFIDGKQSYRIQPAGGASTDFILVNMTIPLTVGKSYTISFWAKAQAARPLTVRWRSADNNTLWSSTDFQLTTDWAEYKFTAVSQNAQAKIEFCCAGSAVTFWLDFLYVYEGSYVAGILPSGKANPGRATSPVPAVAATDVPRDATLGWKPGQFATTHDVYLGTAFNDVNNADRSHPMGVLVSQGQDANTFNPAFRLDFGATYYWRVDEVNAPPTSTIFKGSVWSFTAEPVASKIANITAIASNAAPTAPAQNTVTGSGLDAGDLQSTDTATMWLTGTRFTPPVWIRYDFDRLYKVSELWVWNYNSQFEYIVGAGIKNATIEYSADGTAWKTLGDFTFNQATSESGYAHNTTISFGGVAAKSVKITVKSAWTSTTTFGLSAVRFFYIPTFAREPKPATGAAGIAPDVTLSWRAGREAASHSIYVGADPNALTLAGTSATNSYAPSDLSVGAKYYWRVDEVNMAQATSTWASDVWNFTTNPFIVVDDMESYNDTTRKIFDAWVDGYQTTTNGAIVGVNNSGSTGTFGSTTTIHGGAQSMPLAYGSSGITNSEATRTFDSIQDWTRNGVKTLTLYFYGQTGNTTTVPFWIRLTDQAGKTGKVAYGAAAGEDPIVLADSAWTTWNIPLSSFTGITLSKIKSMTIGVGAGAGSGTLYIDDVRLYPDVSTTTSAATLVGWWKLDNDAKDSSGNGNNGTVVGTPTYVATGKIGASLKLNGTTDYIDCGNPAGLNITDAITLAAWIKPSSLSGGAYQTFISKGDHAYVLAQTNGNLLQVAIYDGTWYSGNSAPVTVAINGSWHHIAGTYDGTQARLYVDGKVAASILHTGVIATNTYVLSLGRNSEATGRLFAGEMDDVRIYHGVLTTSEIVKLANP